MEERRDGGGWGWGQMGEETELRLASWGARCPFAALRPGGAPGGNNPELTSSEQTRPRPERRSTGVQMFGLAAPLPPGGSGNGPALARWRF